MADNIERFPERPGMRQGKKNSGVYIDLALLFCVFVLIVLGLIMIYSTSAYEAGKQFGDVKFYLKKQLIAVGFGLLGLGVAAKVPFNLYRRFYQAAIFVAIASFLPLFTSLAYSANGATRWFKIGGISVQPAEIVKIVIIIYMATYLSRPTTNVDKLAGMLKAMIVPFIFTVAVGVITNNMSSSLIILAIAAVMVFIKSRNYKVFGIALLIGTIAIFIFVLIIKNQSGQGTEGGFRVERIRAWLDPTAYATGKGYQTLQSLYAIGSGGIFGKGIGESVQKLGFIPEAQNDMIFAIICEELGFIGALFVVIIFGILITRCYYIALRVKNPFGGMLVIGVMAHIAIQVVLNIAVVTNTMPNTGISLPFISYGGTSIAFLMSEMGIVINVGKSIRVEE